MYKKSGIYPLLALGVWLLCSSATVLAQQVWRAGIVLTVQEGAHRGMDSCFCSQPIPDDVFARMQGCSFRPNPYISRADLRYLRVLHCDAEGHIRCGEMVCHKQIAPALLDIFRQLYEARYPISSIRLIDDFGGDDERSMAANNTSCFCYRTIASGGKLSLHARGLAIDINPLYNPYVRKLRNGKVKVLPRRASPYVDRTRITPYQIQKGDLCHRLFLGHGFQWGGAWRSMKDYQHFEYRLVK